MIDFFSIPNSNAPIDEWWGYSFQHGWVLLDRNISNNKTNNLIFLRCIDWQHYTDTRENWGNTKLYNGANYFINSLPSDKKEAAVFVMLDNLPTGEKHKKFHFGEIGRAHV